MNKKQRTTNQNSAMHKYFELVAEEANRNGHTFNDMVKAIQKAEVMPTPENVKVLFQAMCMAMYGHDKTSGLHTDEVTKVYESFNLWLAHNFEMHVPFPKDDGMENITQENM